MNHRLSICTFAILFLSYSAAAQPGTLDQTFDSNGIVTTFFASNDSDGEAIVEQTDNKVVLVGTSDSPNSQSLRVLRYESDGQIDVTFGTGGSVLLSNTESVGRAVVMQPDGKILVAGSAVGLNDNDMIVARLNSDGTFDTSFGTSGIALIDAGNGENLCESMVLQADGKIVLGGSAFNGNDADMLIVRLNNDGTIDATFGTAGAVFIDKDTEDNVGEFIQLQGDGKIVLAGTHYVSGSGDFMVARVNADGTMDSGFGTNGVVTSDVVLGNDESSGCALQTDGKIVVHGTAVINVGPSSTEDFCTIRYNTDGSLDSGFGTAGIVTTALGTDGEAAGTSVAVTVNGQIVVAGDALVNGESQFAMARYMADGTLDGTFGTGGKVLTEIGPNEDLCNGMTLQADGQILLAGESDAGNGDSEFAIARYNNDFVGICDCIIHPGLSIYPNPINTSTIVSYRLQSDVIVTMELFDISGKLIQTLFKDELQKQGEHEESLRIADALPSGVYNLVISIDSWTRTIELIK